MKNPEFKTVDDYIAFYPALSERLQAIRAIINREAPEAVEVIKYGIPTFVLNGNMLSIGAFAKHISVFPLHERVVTAVPELSPYKDGAATAKFPNDEPLPLELITKMVQLRVKEQRTA